MRTVFLGTSDFAATVLARLAGASAEHRPHRPALVLTRPDRPAGRGRALHSPPVATTARELGIDLAQPESVNDERARELIAAAMPDLVIVCAFGALIKEPLLSEREMLNVHPSMLPRWRGAAPIERAIMAGDSETGVSIMRLTAGLDSGPVCSSGRIPIGLRDTYGSLAPRLADIGGDLLTAALDMLDRGETLPFSQQDESGVTYAEKIAPADRLLDPARAAVELERVVRALHPHIGARVELPDGTMLGVSAARLLDGSARALGAQACPGDGIDVPSRDGLGVRASDGRLLLATVDGTLELLVVQPPGKRAMEAAAFLRGHHGRV